jgi:hypothetical protein
VREPTRTPLEARKRYIRFLQLPLSCLTKAIWVVGSSPDGGEDASLVTSEDAVRLKREGALSPLFLQASQRFELVADHRFEGEWKSKTLAYIYSVREEQGLDNESEILAWHWHPLTTPGRPDPHVHIRSEHAHLTGLSDLHIPTGRVAFEEVARFLIGDLGCVPARDDWEAVLDDTLGRFRAYRTWA